MFSPIMPSTPDACLRVKRTTGRMDGRTQPDGIQQQHYGFQIMVRAADEDSGSLFADQLASWLDTGVYRVTVNVGENSYCLHSISRTSDVLSLGKETPTSKRSLFAINGLTVINQIS